MGTHVPLPGSTRALVPNSRPAGPADANERVTLTIRTRPKTDGTALADFVAQQSILPLEQRTYLSREQLAEQHGARPEDLDLVEELAHEHNLSVVHRSAAERSIVLSGRLADMLAAFPADVQMYHNASGGYRGRRGEIGVPAELEGVVTGVFGYDTRPKKRRRAHRAFRPRGGPGGVKGQSPTAFAQRYEFPETAGGKPLDGSGQTIAIVELGGGYRTSDLTVYFNEIKVPRPKVVSVSVDHAPNAPGGPNSADGEVMLDIEVAGAVAPKARQVVYFAPNQGNRGFLDAISAAIHDKERKPSVISISWGSPEDGLDEKDRQAYAELFTAAAAVGVTVCVAAGDHGVADLDGQDWDGAVHVDHPAADPMVLACGGTQVSGGKDVAWNDDTPFDPNTPDGGGWAGGGGISERFAIPSYQANANLPVSIRNGAKGRGVPDIAMSATDYFSRVDSYEGASGGTSAVAPLMAGLVARLNQAKGKPVGFLNPFLYANAASVMSDVTQGDNGIKNTVAGYKAAIGWDACTGLGTPIGTAILANL